MRELADLFTAVRTDDVRDADDDDGEAGLDEEELEILRNAGIIAGSSNSRKPRSSRPSAKRIIFVENEEEGRHGQIYWFAHTLQCYAARQYVTKQNDTAASRLAREDTVGAIDLGWKEPENQKREKRKGKKDNAVDAADDTDASERREVAKVRPPFAPRDIIVFSRNTDPSDTSVKRTGRAFTSGSHVAIRRT